MFINDSVQLTELELELIGELIISKIQAQKWLMKNPSTSLKVCQYADGPQILTALRSHRNWSIWCR